ncbi:MAG: sodium-dependent transporter [Eubacterium sp.]|nr:sodium-dependent transporter [Eubacterium sp.]
MERENFISRLGFILVSAGCAIGIGNVWKFPYIAGKYGGGVFVLFYLIFLTIMGIPVLTTELAVGRASRKSAVLGYKALEPEKSKWHIHGWFCIIGCYLLMMYYTTVSGWMLDYFVKYVTGSITDGLPVNTGEVFANMLSNPLELAIFTGLIIVLGFLVCSGGLKNGVEKITKIMMLCLLVLIVVLAVNSIMLGGAGEGVSFYLLPDFNRAKETGIGNVIAAAMNQAFFTLSLGVAAMEIFGSYMSDDHTLTGEAVRITLLDTFVALMAGLIIFPACFTYNVEPGEGPSLIFLTLPEIFSHMPAGRLWGSLFFLFMTFASFSTVTAVFQNLIASASDNFGWSTKKSTFVNCIIILIASAPCFLGYNLLSKVGIFTENAKEVIIAGHRLFTLNPLNMDILTIEDFIVSNLLLPIGSLVFLLFCVSKRGWGFDKYLGEVNKGSGIKLHKGLKIYFRYILPVLIIIILVQGIVQTFITF